MVRFCQILSFAIIVLSVGMTILGAMLFARERSLCYDSLGFGRAILGLGLLSMVSACVGSFTMWKSHWRCHSILVFLKLMLGCGLTIALAFFWRRQAKPIYSRAHTTTDTCVPPYTACAADCLLCEACPVAVLTAVRDYSLSLSPAFSCFLVLYFLAVTIQACMEWCQGGAQSD